MFYAQRLMRLYRKLRRGHADSLPVGTLNHATRVKWVAEHLRAIPAGSRLLDVGAGEMQFRELCSHLEYVSQDFDRYDGKGDGKGLQMQKWSSGHVDIVSDITQIPEPDASYDALLCTEVFEHLPDPILAIEEFLRLLRPNGTLLLTAPFCSLTHFAPFHFYTGFNEYFYRYHLEKAGFDIVEITSNGNFFEFVAQELRRIEDVALKYCATSISGRDLSAIYRLLPTLQRLSNADTGSAELLSFDLQVHAQKR